MPKKTCLSLTEFLTILNNRPKLATKYRDPTKRADILRQYDVCPDARNVLLTYSEDEIKKEIADELFMVIIC